MTATLAVPPAPPVAGSRPATYGASEPLRWTRERFYQAVSVGLFHDFSRTELLDGEVYTRVGELPPHANSLRLSRLVLEAAFHGQPVLLLQAQPISLNSTTSEPEPDLAVLVGPPRAYERRHPGPADILLLVEVSDSSLSIDRRTKAPLYARDGIREYWILNVSDRRLEVYRDPDAANGVYRTTFTRDDGQTVSPLAAPQAVIAVADMLPTAP